MLPEQKKAKEIWETVKSIIKENGVPKWWPRENYYSNTLSNIEILEFSLYSGLVSKEEYRLMKKYKVYEV